MNLKEEILKLRQSGKTYTEIKNILGCSKSTIAYHIGEGQKDKNRIRLAKNRDAAMKEFHDYKESVGCVDCGEKYPHYVLDFDHRPEFEKIGGVYKVLVKFGVEAARKEIEKCDVVCGNCHKIRTYTRKPWGALDRIKQNDRIEK